MGIQLKKADGTAISPLVNASDITWGNTKVPWANVNAPSTFKPSYHMHSWEDLDIDSIVDFHGLNVTNIYQLEFGKSEPLLTLMGTEEMFLLGPGPGTGGGVTLYAKNLTISGFHLNVGYLVNTEIPHTNDYKAYINVDGDGQDYSVIGGFWHGESYYPAENHTEVAGGIIRPEETDNHFGELMNWDINFGNYSASYSYHFVIFAY